MPCIAILISTSKNPCSFLLFLYSLYNKIRHKGKIASACKRGGVEGEGGGRVVKGGGRGKGREMTQTLCVHMNKIKKNKNSGKTSIRK
jgi:hypothetical protein